MNPENAIEVRDLKKHFKIYLDKGSTLKEKALFKKRTRYEYRDVLNGISFDVKKGEAVGLIGSNGCGKSTTLKLLTRIIYPDDGTIEMSGRVASLIELGAGFHPDLSGRENIFINASIFGLKNEEIEERLDDIITFSELEEFIDNPIRTYSSGMYMRLAFSIAINVDADILLIDEILAVGDAAFQDKCFARLKEIKSRGATIVIVSHSLGQIENICEKSIWIYEGKIREEGKPIEVHEKYLSHMAEYRKKRAAKELKIQKPVKEKNQGEDGTWQGDDSVVFDEIRAFDKNEDMQTLFETGEPMRIDIDYRIKGDIKKLVFGIGFLRSDGLLVYSVRSRNDLVEIIPKKKDRLSINFDQMLLLPDVYTVDIAAFHWDGSLAGYSNHALTIEIMSQRKEVGVARIPHTWITGDVSE